MTTHPSSANWEILPFEPVLDVKTVVIWRLDLDVDDACHARLSHLMTAPERARAERLKIPLRRRRWIVSRVALRLFTACASGITLSEQRYRHGPLGKPHLDPAFHSNGLCFNNTDSADCGLIALAIDREVGIDLERLPRATRAERITRRRFAEAEHSAILDAPDAERNHRFLQCWTRKEAWGKAIGVGIRYPMRDIVLCDNLPERERHIEHAGAPWTLHQLQPDAQSIACVVAAGRDFRVHTVAFDNNFERLIDATH